MQLTDIAKFNTFQSVPSLTDIAKFNTFPSLLTIPSSLQYQFMTISSSIHYKFSNKRHKYKATGPSSCCCWFLHCSHVTKATKTTCTKVTKDHNRHVYKSSFSCYVVCSEKSFRTLLLLVQTLGLDVSCEVA